jgi:vacuolar-type H+-ATPase subunit C/Vma6
MDLSRILNQIINQLIRRFVNVAVDKGITHVARRGKSPQEMTDEDRAQAKAGKDMARRAREVRKATRRLF